MIKTKTSPRAELVALAILWGTPLACQSIVPAPQDPPDEIMGRPPELAEDPFADRALPADAMPAGSSGVVGGPARQGRPGVARPAEPERASEPAPMGHRCFSCVRVCPETDTSVGCAQSAQDVICGWGTSEGLGEAMALARAECDATLELARGMPMYSRIDGACPRASCR